MKSPLRERLRDPGLQEEIGADPMTRVLEYGIERFESFKSKRDGGTLKSKREAYERVAASDFSARKAGDPNQQTIFDLSNCSTQIVRSVAKFLLARVTKDAYGSRPWFYARPEGPYEADLASALNLHADWKLRQANHVEMSKEAFKVALDLGDCPIKTTWKRIVDRSDRLANVLFDKKAKQPVVTQDGDYIYDTDVMIPNPALQGGAEGEQGGDADPGGAGQGAALQQQPQGGAGMGEEASGGGGDQAPDGALQQTDEQPQAGGEQPPSAEDGEPPAEDGAPPADQDGAPPFVFQKAPEIAMQKHYTWSEHFIEEDDVLYEGLDEVACSWRDVFWPENAPSLDLNECDAVFHQMQMPLKDVAAKYDPDGDNLDCQETVQKMQSTSPNPKSGEARPKPEMGEQEQVTTDLDNPPVLIVEGYFRFDAFKDGIQRRVFMAFNVETKGLVYINYLKQISPRAQCPVHLYRINKVPGRAYGRGLYEIFEMAAEICDQLLNAILYRNSYNSDPVKIWNPQYTKAGETQPNLEFAPGKTITSKSKGVKPEEILSIIKIPDCDERTYELMQFFMQLIQTESGVTNANQGDMTALPSNSTATGVNSMLESSSVLHQFVLEEMRSCATPQLRYAIELLYFRQNKDETFQYMAGQGNATQSGTMTLENAQVLAQMPMHVEILMTRAKNQAAKEAAFAALPEGANFFTLLRTDPYAAMKLLPIYIQAFKGLEIDNADKCFPTTEEIQQRIDAQKQAQPPQDLAKQSIAWGPENFTPEEITQLKQQMQIQPSAPQPPPAMVPPGHAMAAAGAPGAAGDANTNANANANGDGVDGKIDNRRPFVEAAQ